MKCLEMDDSQFFSMFDMFESSANSTENFSVHAFVIYEMENVFLPLQSTIWHFHFREVDATLAMLQISAIIFME